MVRRLAHDTPSAASHVCHRRSLACAAFVCRGSTVRILMISDVYFPRINGVSTSIQHFRRDLEALGHEITLIAPRYPQSGAVDEVRILRVPSLQVPRDPE